VFRSIDSWAIASSRPANAQAEEGVQVFPVAPSIRLTKALLLPVEWEACRAAQPRKQVVEDSEAKEAKREEVGNKAAELLKGLRRLREDCFRVAEYNSSLAAEINQHQLDQVNQAASARRLRLSGVLHDRESQLLAARNEIALWAIFRAWRLKAYRQRLLLNFGEEEVDSFQRLRWLGWWRVANLESLSCTGIDRHWNENQSLVASHRSILEEAQKESNAAGLRRQNLRFHRLEASCRRCALRRCLCAFSNFTREAVRERSGKRVGLFCANLSTTRDVKWTAKACLKQWHLLMSQRHLNGHFACIVESTSIRGLSDAEQQRASSMCKLILDNWSAAAASLLSEAEEHAQKNLALAVQQRRDAEMTHKLSGTTRIAMVFMASDDRALTLTYYTAWGRHTFLKKAEAEEEQFRLETASPPELHHRTELAQKIWGRGVQASSRLMLLQTHLARWWLGLNFPQLQQRKTALQEHLRTSDDLLKCRSRMSEIRAVRAVVDGSENLLRPIRARLRTAWRRLTIPQATMSPEAEAELNAERDVVAARAEIGQLIAEQKLLKDSLASQYQEVIQTRRSASEVLVLFASWRQTQWLRHGVLTWRLGAMAAMLEREEAWHMLQLSTEAESLRVLHQGRKDGRTKRAIQVVSIMWSTTNLSLFVEFWRRQTRKEILDKLLQAAQAEVKAADEKLQGEKDAREQQAQARYLKALNKSGLFGDSEKLILRTYLLEWRQAIKSEDTGNAKLLRVWNLMDSCVFDVTPQLVVACLQLWGSVTGLRRSQAVVEKVWSSTLLDQRKVALLASIEARLSEGYDDALLLGSLAAWRRLRNEAQVEKVADMAHRQWAHQEEVVDKWCQAAENQREKTWRFVGRRSAALHNSELLRDAIAGWSQEALFGGAEQAARDAFMEVHSMPEVQLRFESIVCDRWIERCLLLRQNCRIRCMVASLLPKWLHEARVSRVERQSLKGRSRAYLMATRAVAEMSHIETRFCFDSWQGAVCIARRRWLEKRVRWLEASLGAPAIASSPRPLAVLSLGETTQPGSAAPSPRLRDPNFAARLERFTSGRI
ncbi:unnamed protein product, partial [Polarella glacialis]